MKRETKYQVGCLPSKITLRYFRLAKVSCIHHSQLSILRKHLINSNLINRIPSNLFFRLGAGSKKVDCSTCSLPLADCIGHYGYIQLQLPVFHIGYFKTITQILQCICKSCSAVLLPMSEKNKYMTMFKRLNMNRITQKALMKKVCYTLIYGISSLLQRDQ